MAYEVELTIVLDGERVGGAVRRDGQDGVVVLCHVRHVQCVL